MTVEVRQATRPGAMRRGGLAFLEASQGMRFYLPQGTVSNRDGANERTPV